MIKKIWSLLLVTLFAISWSSSGLASSGISFNAEEYISEGDVVFRGREEGGEPVTLIACPMTITISYESGVIESEGGTMGAGEYSRVGTCTTGSTYEPLPSRFIVTSREYLGRDNLPGRPERVTGILLRYANQNFLITRGTLRCLYEGTIGTLYNFLWVPMIGGWVETEHTFLPNPAITLVSTLAGSPRCPERDLTIDANFRPRIGRVWRP